MVDELLIKYLSSDFQINLFALGGNGSLPTVISPFRLETTPELISQQHRHVVDDHTLFRFSTLLIFLWIRCKSSGLAPTRVARSLTDPTITCS